MRIVPHSLSGRLVATAVALVALVSALVATLTFLALRNNLTGQLDGQVSATVTRAATEWEHGPLPPPTVNDDRGGGDGGGGDGGHGEEGPQAPFGPGQGIGTLSAVYGGPYGNGGTVLISHGGGIDHRQLSTSALTMLRSVPSDGAVHPVRLPAFGSYRVRAVATPAGTVVGGLPTHQMDETVSTLLGYEALLVLFGVGVAAAVGTVLVRRQLRPLRDVAATAHEVATLPLETGEVGETVRVRDDLTDPRTEVGQVGSALNTLLAHVESALDARHRSELQVRQFVADASHELRTPLSTIQGYAELSRRTTPADAAALPTAMAKVESEAQRMSSLVEDLLLLARLDAGRPLERADVDLTKLVLEAVDDARVVGPDHRWLLDLPDEPLVVPGDEQRLHQVLTNLLNNARRHTPPGTTVTVAARPEPDAVVLTVHDDGPGLPVDLEGNAFERFTRGDSSRTRASGGVGLGLSLVHAISVAHGGSVRVESAPGDTTFTVRLPR